ncbi:MAG: oligopeptide/dipeptide ABC transporter ATP-binding protein, partial [Halobacteriaceae archaeon]
VSVQARVINLLEDLQEDLGLTYLFIAHDLSVVRHIADRTAVMYLGNIVEMGETESLFRTPEHPYTISLLSAIPGSETGTGQDRITLRGTPPNPRYPPDGCPFTTRCPAKIRPDEWDNLTYKQWDAIEEFRVILRERARADRPLREEIQILAGRNIDTVEVNETLDELFGDISLPPEVEDHIETAAEAAKSGNDEKAADYLGDQFGSRCDKEMPIQYEPQEGRMSRCLRHEDEYQDPQTVINERFTTSTSE